MSDAELPRGVRRLMRAASARRDIDDELNDHFDRVEEELVRTGMTPDDAKREARRRFGDVRRWRGRLESIDEAAERRRRAGSMLGAVGDALVHAVRGLRAWPGLSIAVVLAFALGIGANATVYGILDRLLLSPPPHVSEPDGVVRLLVERAFLGRRFTQSTLTFPDFTDFEASTHVAEVAAYSHNNNMTVGRGQEAQRVQVRMVTADFFSLLGVRPALGRFFTEEEDVFNGPRLVVLGHGYWHRSFATSRDVLGKTIDFGHGPYTVIGVAPRGFTGIDLAPVDLWLPMKVSGADLMGPEWLTSRGYYFASAVARLAPGSTAEALAADATRLHRIGRQEDIEGGHYDREARVLTAPVIAAQGPEPSNEVRVARWLAGVSGVVLLIACINVANLLLARALRRRRETAIRLALGVSRARLIGDALADGLVLSMLGAAAAVAASRWGGHIVRQTLLPSVDWTGFAMGGELMLFIAILAVLAGIVSAIVPAVHAARADVNDALRATAGGITRSTHRTRAVLSMAQAALSVLLLIGAGLFLRSLHSVSSMDMGFESENLLVAHVLAEPEGFDDERRRAFFDRAITEIPRLAFVQSVAHASSTPFYDSYGFQLRVPGRDSLPRHPRGGPYGTAVSVGLLETMGIDIVRGRSFAAHDRTGAAAAVIINQAMAKLVWPEEDALGKCIHIAVSQDNPAPPCAEVIGIAEDSRRGSITEEATPQYFVAAAQHLIARPPSALFVRVNGDAEQHAGAIRSAMLGLEPLVRHADVRPLLDLAESELRPWKLGATLFGVFGLIALMVAALGLYSVLVFDVAQRTREIGLRSALGARTGDVVGLVAARAARITVAGIALGLLVALLLAPRLESLLFGIGPRDPVTFGAAALLLLAVAAMASVVPAWRAARVEPNIALRTD
jgi:predicted permease